MSIPNAKTALNGKTFKSPFTDQPVDQPAEPQRAFEREIAAFTDGGWEPEETFATTEPKWKTIFADDGYHAYDAIDEAFGINVAVATTLDERLHPQYMEGEFTNK